MAEGLDIQRSPEFREQGPGITDPTVSAAIARRQAAIEARRTITGESVLGKVRALGEIAALVDGAADSFTEPLASGESNAS
jgi:hypothetical protein